MPVDDTTALIEDGWVIVDAFDPEASIFVENHKNELQVKRSFFHKWPSFRVGSKMCWVLSATGAAFFVGYITGAKAALDSLYRLTKYV